MGQKFIARVATHYADGSVGWAPGGPFDCLGPFAKVQNCSIYGTDVRLTCYATGYADSWFSVPACTRYKGKHVRGCLTRKDWQDDSGAWHSVPEFRVMDSHKHIFGISKD